MTMTIDYKAMFKADEVPTTIMATPTFKITSRTLAKALRISLADAQAMLIEEIHEHRHVLDDVDVTGELTDSQKKAIQFAKRDLLTKHFKAEQARQSVITPATDSKGNNLVNNMEALPETGRYSEDELIRVLNVADKLFDKRSREFAVTLLTQGQEATKEAFGLDTRKFNRKLKQLTEQFEKEGSYSRKKASRLVKSDYQIHHEENVALAEQFLEMIDEDVPNEWITRWLQQSIDNPYFDEAWDKVRYQGKLLREGFTTPAGRQEAYKFVNQLQEMIEKG